MEFLLKPFRHIFSKALILKKINSDKIECSFNISFLIIVILKWNELLPSKWCMLTNKLEICIQVIILTIFGYGTVIKIQQRV